MIGRDHDPDLGSWLILGLTGLAVAAGDAGAQIVVSGICQFDALEDPEDRPPSVVGTIVSAIRAVRGCPTSAVILAGSRVLAESGRFILAAR